MVVRHLFFVLLLNIPLVFGFYINGAPKELHQDYTSKPMVFYDPFGNQQVMMCIPVPVIIQGMNPQNAGRPGHVVPTSAAGFPTSAGHSSSATGYHPSPGASDQHKKPALSPGPNPGGFWSLQSSVGIPAGDDVQPSGTTSTVLPSMSEKSDH